jgi:23S rRNA pseudouridine1911/1915/1917 synthase
MTTRRSPGRSQSRPKASPPSKSPLGAPDGSWTVPEELRGRPLDGIVRTLAGVSWSVARRQIETGKIALSGVQVTDPTRTARVGAVVTRHPNAASPKAARLAEFGDELIAYLDPAVVVVRKPAGISTVPFGDEEPAERERTLDAIVRDVLAKRDHIRGRAPLGVVQRLDKATSGLIVFARTFAAKKHLGQQLREHTMRRVYLAIAHGDVPKRTHRSYLVADRGNGLRGSLRDGDRREGQLAVTHVEPIEKLRGATLIACRLETGRTHQIRIHLSESGHPIVGEPVYVRGLSMPLLEAPRLMLHATELGFEHPQTGELKVFTQPPPEDFQSVLERLRAS